MRILVAVDLSRLSEDLILYGCSLAVRLDVEIAFVHVFPHPTMWKEYEPWLLPELDTEVRDSARKRISGYIRRAEDTVHGCRGRKFDILLRDGNPSDAIIKLAREGDFNLIVIGYRGQSTIERMIMGSTATNVARYAHCSVLIFRPGMQVF